MLHVLKEHRYHLRLLYSEKLSYTSKALSYASYFVWVKEKGQLSMLTNIIKESMFSKPSLQRILEVILDEEKNKPSQETRETK